jgi:hypothetical protein
VDNTKLELLDERIIYVSGCFKRVKRWYRGVHAEIGVVIMGLTGLETVVEKDIIIPLQTFFVN